MQTVEAIIEASGSVKLLSRVRLPGDRKALLTILDEEPDSPSRTQRERLLRAFKNARSAKLFSNIKDPVEWQKRLRDEWD